MREPGFYWVRRRKYWLPAEWLENLGIWLVLGLIESEWKDEDFDEIGPRIHPPVEVQRARCRRSFRSLKQ